MKAMMILAALLTGCAQTPAPGTDEAPKVVGEGHCDAAAAQDLVGREATSELAAEALRRTGARTMRWLSPGMAVTMDYRADRLNIAIDEQRRVTAIRCG